MKIISSFTDVYDLQMSMSDNSRVWTRETEVFTKYYYKPLMFTREVLIEGNSSQYIAVFKPIFFCDEVYWSISIQDTEVLVSSTDVDTIESVLRDNNASINYLSSDNSSNVGAFKTHMIEPSQKYVLEALREYKQPLVYVNDDTHTITTNPSLNKLEFKYQEIDSNLYRVHQLIEQYIFGVLKYE